MHSDGTDNNSHDDEQFGEALEEVEQPRHLPADLPTSLDDRKNFRSWNEDTEYYDVWQGKSRDTQQCVGLLLTLGNRPIPCYERANRCQSLEFQPLPERTG